MAKGKFETSQIKEHHVTCSLCENMFVTHFRYQKTAIEQARENGWRIRNKQWRCPTHAQQSVQPTIESVGSTPAVVVEGKVASPAESG